MGGDWPGGVAECVGGGGEVGQAGEAERLCGITQVTGYLTDDETRDVIVIGRVDPSLPPLHLDDLAIALRNVWLTYARTEGRTRYYSPPGCSIDPNPENLRELQRVGTNMHDSATSDKMDSALDQWSKIGRRPQSVRVMGVPFDSRFAKVMVDADYYMKRLVNGSVALGISGFQSLGEMTAEVVRQELAKGSETSSIPEHSLNRFWFSPGESTYEEDDGVITLKSCRVKLLTEEEFVTEHGRVAGFGRPSSLAAKFARGFTDHYDQIAAARPIYKELEGLFRLVALARLMDDGHASSGGLTYLLKSHRVATAPVSRQVLGLTNLRRIVETKDTASGKATISVVLQSCGGVSMDVRPKRVGRPARPKTTTASKHTASAVPHRPSPSLKKTVLAAREAPGKLSWDFPLDR